MAKRLRVGVIGVGNMGSNHARVYMMLPHVQLIGVADPNAEARNSAATYYNTRSFEDYKDLLTQVEAVSIAVPTALHHRVALEALRRGIHVLVEKPIAADSREARDLVDCARTQGVILQVGHIERFNPAIQELGRILATEKVLAISARRMSPPTPHIRDVDVIFDLLIHDVDLALALTRSPIRHLNALASAVREDNLDLVAAQFAFENGVIVDLVASKITQLRVRELEVTTEHAYITVNYLTRELSIYRRGSVTAAPSSEQIQYRQEFMLERPIVRMAEPLYLELEHFVAVIGGAPPLFAPEDALLALEVAIRVSTSVSRRWPSGSRN